MSLLGTGITKSSLQEHKMVALTESKAKDLSAMQNDRKSVVYNFD